MMSETVFYLFLFPWMFVIASVPGIVMTYLFVGLGVQMLNFLPEKNPTVITD